MKKITLPVVIEKDEEGYFAYCPSLQGCYSQADSYEEIIENIKDAIQAYLDTVEEINQNFDSVYVEVG